MSKYYKLSTESDDSTFSNRDIAVTLRSSCKNLNEIVRALDSSHQSDMAGRLHTLTVELRQLASLAESRPDNLPPTADQDHSASVMH